MMSLFSSFDALCAEYLGQKVGCGSSLIMSSTIVKKEVKNMGQKQKETSISTPSTQVNSKSQKKQHTTPRFAIELDGLNCFETIVSS
ncbi:hypothetical protein IFM89_021106 [Coptis chinensis]|uniref:Avr9/Cf-9 rapidly elicited protein n=1 Tax=Coptis chinensis TaxID=261450 RepID=A0A835HJ19_9MAGN|nr:hypothetical protein IFM89_021106 [Coptis chinensis]